MNFVNRSEIAKTPRPVEPSVAAVTAEVALPERTIANEAKCRVLVIDDSPDMVRLVQAYLADSRISVTVAYNGSDGIAGFRNGVFDLVLMDMVMPGVDGYAAARSIRTWEKENGLPRTPIAALTAVSDFGASNRILSAGCTLHLTKPITRTALLQIVSMIRNASPNRR
jgi:CheY-like chemotaxis protein